MQLKRKLPWILTGKSLLAVASITLVALALATYTATVTINLGATSFVQGVTTQTWTIFPNDAGQKRYLPATSATPLGSTQTANGNATNAFSVTNDNVQGTAVEITLSSLMATTNFIQFEITALQWNGATWTTGTSTTIYTTATGLTTQTFIQGITGNSTNLSVGFLHIPKTQVTAVDIEIVVTYSVANSPSGPITASFVFTPSRTTAF